MHTVEIMVCIAKNLFIYSNVEKGENVKFVFFNSKKKKDFFTLFIIPNFFPLAECFMKKNLIRNFFLDMIVSSLY